MTEHGSDPDRLIAELQRWEVAGGVWRVAGDDRSELTVVLCTRDGGEEMGRLSSADDVWRAYVTDPDEGAPSAPGSQP